MKKVLLNSCFILLAIILIFILLIRSGAFSFFLIQPVSAPQATPIPAATVSPAPAPQPTAAVTPSPAPAVPTPGPTPQPTPSPEPLSGAVGGEYMLRFEDEKNGAWFDYWVFLPEKPVKNLPLIVFLHGDSYIGMPAELINCGIVKQTKSIYGNDFPFVLLVPCTRDRSWEDGRTPETLIDLINAAADEYCCSRDEIILTGHSRGAIGVWNTVSLYPGVFCRALPVSCPNDRVVNFDSFKDVPVWAHLGGADNDYGKYHGLVEYLIEGINAAGGDAVLTVHEGFSHGDMETEGFTPEIFDWLLSGGMDD